MSATEAPPSFHLLAKPRGAVCNLDCKYCFFLSKEELYPGSSFRMSEEMLERCIRHLLGAHRTPEVDIAWQGGEPTPMGLDFYRRAVELAEQHRRPEQRVLHSMQTNGVLCDGYKAFFAHGTRPMRLMAELLRVGRPSAEIMTWYARQDEQWRATSASVGRNEPCPCGSGRNVKHCHGRTGIVGASAS